jgi:hypothetical protein
MIIIIIIKTNIIFDCASAALVLKKKGKPIIQSVLLKMTRASAVHHEYQGTGMEDQYRHIRRDIVVLFRNRIYIKFRTVISGGCFMKCSLCGYIFNELEASSG